MLREWIGMVRDIEERSRPLEDYNEELRWRGEDPRETQYAANKLLELASADSPATRGVWTGRHLAERDDFEVVHCIPCAHWHNNALWNLLPSTANANSPGATVYRARAKKRAKDAAEDLEYHQTAIGDDGVETAEA